jgi:hypothetical protein
LWSVSLLPSDEMTPGPVDSATAADSVAVTLRTFAVVASNANTAGIR